jgi:DHA1 family bicyclomycin/chloramphenicol resistance-like MFS transporter
MWSLRLNESLLPEQRRRLDWATLSGSARHVMGNRIFLRYTATTTILFAAFISFISSSERIITEIYDRPDLFVLIFSGTGVLLAIFSFSNAQFVSRFGTQRTTRGLLATYFVLASILIVFTLMSDGTPHLLTFVLLVAGLQGINVMVRTNSGAIALEPLGDKAGMAAAIFGTSFLVLGSLMASVIDGFLVNNIVPLALAYFVQGLLANGLVQSHRTSVDADLVQEPPLQQLV